MIRKKAAKKKKFVSLPKEETFEHILSVWQSLRDTEKNILSKEFTEHLGPIREKYSFISEFLDVLEPKKPTIPITCFFAELTPLESIVRYLKEEQKLNFHKIGILLNRNERNIWHTYNSSRKKYSSFYKYESSNYSIPLYLFSEKKLSPFEIIVHHLREVHHLKFTDIAHLLKKDSRTIWTIYRRAIKKNDR